MNINLTGITISSVVGALDIATAEVPELKKDLITLPNGVVINSQDLSRLSIATIGALGDVVSEGGSEAGAISFYSEIPLVMKSIRKIAGV